MGKNGKGREGERGSQSVVCPVYRAEYATCRMLVAFLREPWSPYIANNVNCFCLADPGGAG